MPDGRMLSKSISHSFQLAEVSLEADYLFARCIPHLDREGRMPGNPRLVKSIACPLREEIPLEAIPALLCELAKSRLIRWYSVDGQEVVEFPGFQNHQKGARFEREAPSRLPAHTSAGAVDLLRTNSGPTPAKVRVSEVKVSEVKLREVEVEVEEPDYGPRCEGMSDEETQRFQFKVELETHAEDRGYGPRERLIAIGEDITAWRTPQGVVVPLEDRLRLLRLADANLADPKGKAHDLRAALKYAIAQQYDPFEVRKSDAPKPGSEAAAVRNESPSEKRTGPAVSDMDRIRAEKKAASESEYAQWRDRIRFRLNAEPQSVKDDLTRQVAEALGDTLKALPHVAAKTAEAKLLEIYGKRIGEPQPSVAA